MTEIRHVAFDGWRKVQVELHGPAGRWMVDGMEHPKAPGLAVTGFPFGVFQVTHVGSGWKAGPLFERCGNAMMLLAQLSKMTDWTVENREQLLANLRKRDADPVPFPDCTVTAQGVTRPMTYLEFLQDLSGDAYFGANEFPWESPDEEPAERAAELLDPETVEAPHA